MVRRARIFLDQGVYHVYCRVSRGEYVFQNSEDAESFVDAAKYLIGVDRLTVLAWCLMSNHYHLVVRTSTIPLWRSMLRFQPRVSRSHNRRRRVFGPLWQGRYRARLVQDEAYYHQLIAYVHLNPVDAGLVSDPADWRWSGHAALIGQRDPILTDVKTSLRGFDEKLSEARRKYLNSVRNVADMRLSRDGVRKLPWWKQARNNRQLVPEEEIPDGATDWRDAPVLRNLPPPQLWEIAHHCERESGCALADICGRSNAPRVATVRDVLARLAVDGFGYKVIEVAEFLEKHPNSISRWRSKKMADHSYELFERVVEKLNHKPRP